MGDFLFQFFLFAAKSGVLIVFLVAFVILVLGVISAKRKQEDSLEVEKLNEHIDTLKETLEAEIYSKHDFKAIQKERKKNKKAQLKAEKSQRGKEAAETKPRIFLLRFKGDMHATEVESLREAITAILTIATPADEVLVVLESPGGVVHEYGLAASQLDRIRAHNIPLTCAVDKIAASGGYMMACVANRILAAPFAVIGSIGVLAQLPNFHRLLDKLNVDIEHHTAGDHKTTLTMLGKNSAADRKKFCDDLQTTHQLFKQFVSQHREQVDIHQIATGEHWYGTDALELNLVDEIKTSDDYLMEMAATKDIFEVAYYRKETISHRLTGKLNRFLGQSWFKWRQVYTQWLAAGP